MCALVGGPACSPSETGVPQRLGHRAARSAVAPRGIVPAWPVALLSGAALFAARVNKRLVDMEEFEKAEIEFAYPTQQLYVTKTEPVS